ncbi:MAG: sensor histidine kinase [Negativicutes bacterium]|nr:sensor histidine kinase [Negativicutes bacterium]
MKIAALKLNEASQWKAVLGSPPRTAASYERELATCRAAEAELRETLDKAETLLRQKDEAIEYQALMRKESDHRLLNDMQIVVSMLSMQSRASGNAETSAQLVIAANRVSMIARIHQRLHGFDGVKTVAFRQYLEEFCHEFSAMLSSKGDVARVVMVDGAEMELPATTALPLAFILSELLTNAAKYGEGQITVWLEAAPEKRHRLAVCNDGPSLPDNFDPAASKGLGMKIIQSFVRQIGGELRAQPGKTGHARVFPYCLISLR